MMIPQSQHKGRVHGGPGIGLSIASKPEIFHGSNTVCNKSRCDQHRERKKNILRHCRRWSSRPRGAQGSLCELAEELLDCFDASVHVVESVFKRYESLLRRKSLVIDGLRSLAANEVVVLSMLAGAAHQLRTHVVSFARLA